MRATSDSPAMFLAARPADAPRDEAASDAPSIFAATLGLATTVVPAPARDEETTADPAPTPELGAAAAIPVALLTPPVQLTPASADAGDAADAASTVKGGARAFPTVPTARGIDISGFDLTSDNQPSVLPLEAALQQLTASLDQALPGAAAPTPMPTAAAAPAESSPARVETPSHAIVEVVARHVARGAQHLTMVLRPAELGEVKVRIEHVRNDQVKITLEAERRETTTLLRDRVPELQAVLAEQGVVVRSVDVSLQADSDIAQRGPGGDATPQHHERQHRDDPSEAEETTRPPQRTKRNPKDLDVLV